MNWQPIETYPDDGRWVLACWSKHARLVCAISTARKDETGDWVEYQGPENASPVGEPTHWMPLPPPPGDRNG